MKNKIPKSVTQYCDICEKELNFSTEYILVGYFNFNVKGKFHEECLAQKYKGQH